MELTDRVTRETRDAAGILVHRPRFESGSDARCKRLLVAESRPAILGICLSESPSAWYDGWTEALGGPPANAAVITTPDRADDAPDGVTVETVPTPGNLTGIGMQVTKVVGSWTDEDDTAADAVVSMDSLGSLLQYAPLETVYRFLHPLVGRLDAVDAVGLFFLDSAARDATTVTTVESLFHGVLAYDEEGDDWRLRTQ